MKPIDYQSEIDQAPRASPRGRSSLLSAELAVVVLMGLMVGLRQHFDALQRRTPVRPVEFEVRLAELSPGPGLTAANTPDLSIMSTVYLYSEPVVTNAHIESANVIESVAGSAIQFTLDAVGTKQMMQATADHRDKPLVILIDGRIRATMIVGSPVGHQGILNGPFTKVEAERIAQGITAR